ncbi:hypothetical protein chiPu_0031364 [Chiloscyllium punctatum]|uniref:Uncharacterized protein n=1 Tax=Chiloscyllium punctatum TaxID=137246 RepID=A0A401TWH5_CHIPU|nr:hypothetical protein [Chiloscyllium punctatum]
MKRGAASSPALTNGFSLPSLTISGAPASPAGTVEAPARRSPGDMARATGTVRVYLPNKQRTVVSPAQSAMLAPHRGWAPISA